MSEPFDYKLFASGVELFNRHAFFEAHEIWEQLWKKEYGESRVLLQGLIQAAAALVHVQRGNHRGATRVWAKASPKLALNDEFWGIDLKTLCFELENYFAKVATDGQPGPAPTINFLKKPNRPAD